MNIPIIPDKSHKLFIFIGLGLLIYSWNFNYQESKSYEEKRVAYNLELKKGEIQLGLIKKELSEIEKSFEKLSNKFSAQDSLYMQRLNLIQSKIDKAKDLNDLPLLKKYELQIAKEVSEMSKLVNNMESYEIEYFQIEQKRDSIDFKTKQLYDLADKASLKKYELENVEDWLDEVNKFTYLLAILGFITFLFGIIGWFKSESFEEEIKKRENLHLPTFSNECQSCGVKFNSINKFGTEKNENNNYHFCINCYELGEFTNPEITLDEMKENVHKKLFEKCENEKFIKKYLNKIAELERWK